MAGLLPHFSCCSLVESDGCWVPFFRNEFIPGRNLSVSGAVQQLAAGLAVFIPAMLFEKAPHAITMRSSLAVAYLVVLGSLVGFSAFIYAVDRLPVAMVSIYIFVNPVVAVFLGGCSFVSHSGRLSTRRC